jgi:hypothetical protein
MLSPPSYIRSATNQNPAKSPFQLVFTINGLWLRRAKLLKQLPDAFTLASLALLCGHGLILTCFPLKGNGSFVPQMFNQ